MSERKLATIRKISDLLPIHNADAIEVAVVDGWQCVVKKGEFQPGEYVVYCEVDSWVPHDIAPYLSKGKEPREYNGIKGERLRTVKLRGQISQGLVLPISILPHSYGFAFATDNTIGEDVSHILGITKWEPPTTLALAGNARRIFPWFLKKTDQERVQNLNRTLEQYQDDEFEVTLKLDGSSCTIYKYGDDSGVCSRNLELKMDESNADNLFVSVGSVILPHLVEYCNRNGRNLALQGELMGPGIQGNREGLSKHTFFLFDIWDIDNQEYLDSETRQDIFLDFTIGDVFTHVNIIEKVKLDRFKSVQDFLDYAERPSINHPVAEGVVFKSVKNPNFSFKAISNTFLLKEK